MTTKQTPYDLCKKVGIKNVDELVELLEEEPAFKRTLHNWSDNRPALLKAVILGAAEIKRRNDSDS